MEDLFLVLCTAINHEYRAAMMSTVAWYDVINWLVMLQGLIGLQAKSINYGFSHKSVANDSSHILRMELDVCRHQLGQ